MYGPYCGRRAPWTVYSLNRNLKILYSVLYGSHVAQFSLFYHIIENTVVSYQKTEKDMKKWTPFETTSQLNHQLVLKEYFVRVWNIRTLYWSALVLEFSKSGSIGGCH